MGLTQGHRARSLTNRRSMAPLADLTAHGKQCNASLGARFTVMIKCEVALVHQLGQG
jgi:hypothetical protein